jgi:CDP-diacylglycerol--glycerol-3-phosphate 3-phosphatidyltransferase/cardiolipin synthase
VERFDFRDLLTIPGLLTLVRAPLAAAFPLAFDRPMVAVGILAAAGISDVLDGWWARRTGQMTLTGAIVDPVLDKVFVLTVAVSLLYGEALSLSAVLLLGVRDLVELPLMAWLLSRPRLLAARAKRVKANIVGKAVTALQFGTVIAALFGTRYADGLAAVTGMAGLGAGVVYWVGMLRRDRRRSSGSSGQADQRMA